VVVPITSCEVWQFDRDGAGRWTGDRWQLMTLPFDTDITGWVRLGLVMSVALAALSWHQVTFSLAERTLGGPLVQLLVSYRAVAMAVGWTVIAVAGALGLRRVAALGAAMGLAGEAAVLARRYAEAPG
jgi:hypothetical protein